MSEIIDIVLPVFCLIGLGYFIARTQYLGVATGDALADFVFKVAVPILLMRSLATAQFDEVNPWAYLIVYFSSVVAAWTLGTVLIAYVFKRGHRASIIAGVSASFSNLVLLGIPLIERAYGQEGLQILFFLIAFHLPVMMTASTFLMERAVRADGVESTPLDVMQIGKKIIRSFAVNPIIIGILAGIIWRFSGIGLSGIPETVMNLIGETTGPLALIAVGMSLVKYSIKGNLFPAFCLALVSIIIMPATFYWVGTTLFVMPVLWLKVGLLAAASPTGVNAYLFATYFNVAHGMASNAIILSLLGAIITVPLWLTVLG